MTGLNRALVVTISLMAVLMYSASGTPYAAESMGSREETVGGLPAMSRSGIPPQASKLPPPRQIESRPKWLADPNAKVGSLRENAAQAGLYLGSMVDSGSKNGWESTWFRETFASQFNLMEPGNQFKWAIIHPQKDRFDFAPADSFVAFAAANNMKVRGHNLLWGMANPPWLGNGPAKTYSTFTGAELERLLINHIRTVIGHYREHFPGTVKWWDVTNELMGWNNKFNSDGILWSKIGNNPDRADYVRVAFRAARLADPGAILCMNDWEDEGSNPVRTRNMLEVVKRFRAEGIPIDCVGMEMHLTLKYPPTYAQVLDTMKAYADIGVEVQITEFDIQGPREPQNWTAAAALAANMLQACLNSTNCTAFNNWGFSQKYYLNDANHPERVTMLPWDEMNKPSQEYSSLRSTIKDFVHGRNK